MPNLVQITARIHVRRYKVFCVALAARRDVSKTTSIVLITAPTMHLPRICTLQVQAIHGMRHSWRTGGSCSREYS